MELIEGRVRTNVDWLKTKRWPIRFHPVIEVGHYIKSDGGTEARITRITHAQKEAVPYLIIEVWAEPKT